MKFVKNVCYRKEFILPSLPPWRIASLCMKTTVLCHVVGHQVRLLHLVFSLVHHRGLRLLCSRLDRLDPPWFGQDLLCPFLSWKNRKNNDRFSLELVYTNRVGCALTFASEAKFEIEAKISLRLEAKKSLISHDSLRCETPKIWSKNEGKISKN